MQLERRTIMKVADVLATKGTNVITILPDQTIKEAVDLMESHNIGGLVVVNKSGDLKGILTERDLIRYAATENPTFSAHVGTIMSRNVIVGVLQDEIDVVAHTMTEKRFRHLPIVDDDKLVGILTIGDVVKAQRDRYEGELHTLQIQIIADDEEE
jgi:CBS domain-containing protein